MTLDSLTLLIVGLGVKWFIYTALIWVVIKIQKLNYNLPGLFGSSFAALLSSLIPLVGPYLSYVVLVLCLWKCTRADIAPDIIFTVMISGALMFCVNLWVLGAMMPCLRPGAAESRPVQATEPSQESAEAAPSARKPSTSSPPIRNVKSSYKGLVLKGISYTRSKQIGMIGYGSQIHNVKAGETVTIKSKDGPFDVRCEKVTRGSVILSLGDEQIELVMR